MNKKLVLIGIIICVSILLLSSKSPFGQLVSPLPSPRPILSVRSIDTMKYSRDLAREKRTEASFDKVIDQQVKAIAQTGASHVAIATPYDEEFLSYLTRWVASARKYNLHVWFRGNFSGWEKWFDHPRMTRKEHLDQTAQFIARNPELFENGDIFTACPECENGGPGDPRLTGDVVGHRQFLIDEYQLSQQAFAKIGKQVEVGYNSMNYDVALAIMDKPTTQALGNVVAIDHYVKTPLGMIKDIKHLEEQSGGKIFLGEFGAPIPDLQGKMSQEEQSAWLTSTLELLSTNNSVIGLNYWVNVGGSTELWDDQGNPRLAVAVPTDYYSRLIPFK